MNEPIRTCIAYGVKKSKRELLRLVYTPEGIIVPDLKGKQKGRGANITPSLEAFELAVKKNAFVRAFKLKPQLGADQLAELKAQFGEAIAEKEFRPNNKPVTIKVKKQDLQKVTSAE